LWWRRAVALRPRRAKERRRPWRGGGVAAREEGGARVDEYQEEEGKVAGWLARLRERWSKELDVEAAEAAALLCSRLSVTRKKERGKWIWLRRLIRTT